MAKKRVDPAFRVALGMVPPAGEADTSAAWIDRAGVLEVPASEPDQAAVRTCRDETQRRKALPLIADALIEKALTGSVPHVKSLMDLGVYERGALRPKRRAKKKSTADLLLERWEQVRDNR